MKTLFTQSLISGLVLLTLSGCDVSSTDFDSSNSSLGNPGAGLTPTPKVDPTPKVNPTPKVTPLPKVTPKPTPKGGSGNGSLSNIDCSAYEPNYLLNHLLAVPYSFDNTFTVVNPINQQIETFTVNYDVNFTNDTQNLVITWEGTVNETYNPPLGGLLGMTFSPERLKELHSIRLTTREDISYDVSVACDLYSVTNLESFSKLQRVMTGIDPELAQLLALLIDVYKAGAQFEENGEFNINAALAFLLNEYFTVDPQTGDLFIIVDGQPVNVTNFDGIGFLADAIAALLDSPEVLEAVAQAIVDNAPVTVPLATAREIAEELISDRLAAAFTGPDANELVNLILSAVNSGETSTLETRLLEILAGVPGATEEVLVQQLLVAIAGTDAGNDVIVEVIDTADTNDSIPDEVVQVLADNPQITQELLQDPAVVEAITTGNTAGNEEEITEAVVTVIANDPNGVSALIAILQAAGLNLSADIITLLTTYPDITIAIINNSDLINDLVINIQPLEDLADDLTLAAEIADNDGALALIATDRTALASFVAGAPLPPVLP